ncbi:MAG: hypothetical protein COB81_05740 [Flavobacteriaceae bacterium]|nr:MAG: hypothetical protein COB81_05740 [Flavobacteriaceae bacterium]
MGARELREKWVENIGKVDDHFLRMLDDLYENYIKTNERELSDAHKEILDARLLEHYKNPESGKKWSVLNEEICSKYGL